MTEKSLAVISAFSSMEAFEGAQRMAKALCSSSLVPKAYQGDQNIGSALIALELAQRMNASPLMVMQNIDVIHGRPSWRAQMAIAAINASGRFSPIRYDLSEEGEEEQVEYFVTAWDSGQKSRTRKTALIRNRSCVAYAFDAANGDRLDGPLIDMRMAVREGWYGKPDSKWRSIPELMLRYRAASWWQRLYAPELLMGLQIDVDVRDAIDVIPESVEIGPEQEPATMAQTVAKKVAAANVVIKDTTPAKEQPADISEFEEEEEDAAEGDDGPVVDARGVPFNELYHGMKADGSPAILPNGAFRKRRGCDHAALTVYERGFLNPPEDKEPQPEAEKAEENKEPQMETEKAEEEPATEYGFPEILTAIQRSANYDDLRRAQEMLEGFSGPQEQKEELASFVREQYAQVTGDF